MAIDWKRTAFISFAAVAGLIAGLFGQPFIHGNERAISVIVNVFSILAGFLLLTNGLFGDFFFGGSFIRPLRSSRSVLFQLERKLPAKIN